MKEKKTMHFWSNVEEKPVSVTIPQLNWEYGKSKARSWWQKKIEKFADEVKKGKYGKVIKEGTEDSGWFDGVVLPVFEVERNGKIVKLKVSESGVMEKYPQGGAGSISKLKKVI